ncbi:MAG: hypothetical protein NTY19_11205 [Planctomycetota bacterium]|nr:hypothetical protein [Planctomycetota bacterium]
MQHGINEDGWAEVLKKKVGDSWTDFTGDEAVIAGDLSELADGQVAALASDESPELARTFRPPQRPVAWHVPDERRAWWIRECPRFPWSAVATSPRPLFRLWNATLPAALGIDDSKV